MPSERSAMPSPMHGDDALGGQQSPLADVSEHAPPGEAIPRRLTPMISNAVNRRSTGSDSNLHSAPRYHREYVGRRSTSQTLRRRQMTYLTIGAAYPPTRSAAPASLDRSGPIAYPPPPTGGSFPAPHARRASEPRPPFGKRSGRVAAQAHGRRNADTLTPAACAVPEAHGAHCRGRWSRSTLPRLAK